MFKYFLYYLLPCPGLILKLDFLYSNFLISLYLTIISNFLNFLEKSLVVTVMVRIGLFELAKSSTDILLSAF
jgi:hypothetical protein